jgi:hypothetical protein
MRTADRDKNAQSRVRPDTAARSGNARTSMQRIRRIEDVGDDDVFLATLFLWQRLLQHQDKRFHSTHSGLRLRRQKTDTRKVELANTIRGLICSGLFERDPEQQYRLF